MTLEKNAQNPIEIASIQVSELSPTDSNMQELGRKLLTDSMNVGVEFCKQMIGVCSGALGVFIILITTFLPKDYKPIFPKDWPFILDISLPSVGFLVAMLLFVNGYQPYMVPKIVNLDDINQIAQVRDTTIKLRATRVKRAVIVFTISLVLAIVASTTLPFWNTQSVTPTKAIVVEKNGVVLCGELRSDATGNVFINNQKLTDIASLNVITTECSVK